uniref:Nucleoporin NDC1 n=1 Tax=Globodera pallida TaxID=36090 RepID=A0A183C524_GLOPA
MFSALILALLAVSLQYSPLAPISSIKAFVCAPFTMIIFSANILQTFLVSFVIRKQLVWFSSSSSLLLWLVSSVVAALYYSCTTNFQLRFAENRFDLSAIKRNFDSLIIGPMLGQIVTTAKIFCVAWVAVFNLVLLLRPLHSFLPSLFAFWHFSDFLLLLFAQGLILRLIPSVVNYFVMKPIEFAMPTVFFAAAEGLTINSPAVTLTNALESKDPIIKLFALHQLQRMCSTNALTRKPFYALSQPGGHPRNWHSLRDVAVAHVRNVRNVFQLATQCKTAHSVAAGATSMCKSFAETSVNKSNEGNEDNTNKSLMNAVTTGSLLNVSTGSTGVLNQLYEAKLSFFIPPTLNPRPADAFLSEREQCRRLIIMPRFCESIVLKLKQFLLVPSPIVSSYDTHCALCAIKALSAVISHSLQEDEFGVVQKDMSQSLSELTRLSIAIDAYVRTSGRSSKSIERNIVVLDEGLATELKEIRKVFGSHISELNLYPTELEVFQMLT